MILMLILLIISVIILYKKSEKIKMFIKYKKGIIEFQKKHSLTNTEIKLFKETMDLAKQQIIEWEEVIKCSPNLKKNQSIQIALKSSKEIFKYFMDFPSSITVFNDFLYVKLPGVVAASEKYSTIDSSEIKTAEVAESLETMLISIIAISESITDDYEKSVEEDLNEVELTQRMIDRYD